MSHEDTERGKSLKSVSRCLRGEKENMTLTKQEKQALIDLANVARQRAYAPYSNYPVGAALRTKSGRIFTGVNVENAAELRDRIREHLHGFLSHHANLRLIRP